MKLHLKSVVAILLIAGCAEIKSSSRLVQTLDKPLTAGVGDTVIEMNTYESLPNAFGKADILGRTRPTGKLIVTYLGLEQERAVFERQTIRLQSDATTMNSSPLIIPQTSTTTYSGSTTIGGTKPRGVFSGSATSRGVATTTAPPLLLPPSGSKTEVISNDVIRYYLDLTQDRKMIIEGKEILVEHAAISSVRYRIKDLD